MAGADVERLRLDAGLPRARLADAAGVDDSYMRRVEQGTVSPSIETYARLAAALGADLAVRLYPNTGPAVRDRHQAGILEALLASKHARWHAYPEVAVRRPSRGWIDLVLHDARERTIVATEIQSDSGASSSWFGGPGRRPRRSPAGTVGPISVSRPRSAVS